MANSRRPGHGLKTRRLPAIISSPRLGAGIVPIPALAAFLALAPASPGRAQGGAAPGGSPSTQPAPSLSPAAAAPAASPQSSYAPPPATAGGIGPIAPALSGRPDPSIFAVPPSVPAVPASPLFPNPGPEERPEGDGTELLLDVIQHIRDYSIVKPREIEIGLGILEQLHRIYGRDHPGAFPKKPFPANETVFDALGSAIQAIASAPGARENERRIIERGIAAYVRHMDRFGSYHSAAALRLYEENESRRGYTGTGLTVEELPDGTFILYPLAGEAGDLAGVLAGDFLNEIDGQPVHGINRIEVQSRLRGPASSVVKLGLLRGGRPLEISVRREIIRPSPVEIHEDDETIRIRIRKFDSAAVEEIRALLLRLDPGQHITLDLRSCIGGEFDAGIAVAKLFLPKDAEIAFLATPSAEEVFKSDNPEPYKAKKMTIFQDGGTASAAELLIAALQHSAPFPVATKGAPTYGKASTQRRFVLKTGGLLTISDAKMYGPGHVSWETQPLEPTDGPVN